MTQTELLSLGIDYRHSVPTIPRPAAKWSAPPDPLYQRLRLRLGPVQPGRNPRPLLRYRGQGHGGLRRRAARIGAAPSLGRPPRRAAYPKADEHRGAHGPERRQRHPAPLAPVPVDGVRRAQDVAWPTRRPGRCRRPWPGWPRWRRPGVRTAVQAVPSQRTARGNRGKPGARVSGAHRPCLGPGEGHHVLELGGAAAGDQDSLCLERSRAVAALGRCTRAGPSRLREPRGGRAGSRGDRVPRCPSAGDLWT